MLSLWEWMGCGERGIEKKVRSAPMFKSGWGKPEKGSRHPCFDGKVLRSSGLKVRRAQVDCIAECESAREFRSAQGKNKTRATFPKRGRARE